MSGGRPCSCFDRLGIAESLAVIGGVAGKIGLFLRPSNDAERAYIVA
jgi:hypothetical protein